MTVLLDQLGNLDALLAALMGGAAVQLQPIAGEVPVIRVSIAGREELPIFVTCSDTQILCLCYLWTESEVQPARRAELHAALLDLNPSVPLSSFGRVDGRYLLCGALKRALTEGAWNVAEIVHLDADARRIVLVGVGRETGRNPYYRHLYALSLDGGEPQLLTPEDADHDITLSPDARWFVDRHSTTTTPPVTVLRGIDGTLVTELERADLSRLTAAGWTPPAPFTVKARDGETDLYGLMFTPSNFDPAQRYPVVLYLYPGPQTGSIRSRSFLAAHGDNQALAELGFVVVALDGMGTPWRSKSFHAAWAGDVADNTLPDQITGLEQLAARHPWLDLSRVGIWGHSGGGNATATAMFRYPEFFKVGVSQAGNHDNRSYADAWAEKWQGLEVMDADGRSNYDSQGNQNFVQNLKGKLLLVHGGLDDNVPPYTTLMVVDALNRANKDYDLIWLPTSRHGFGSGQLGHYVTRRRWDYFVRWLLGSEPPAGIDLMPQKLTEPR